MKNLGFSLEGSGSLLVLNVGNGVCWKISYYYAGRLVINSFWIISPFPTFCTGQVGQELQLPVVVLDPVVVSTPDLRLLLGIVEKVPLE